MSGVLRVPFATEAERVRNAPWAAEHLRAGGVIAYPTETVYGFGCALLQDALATLAELKSREPRKPFLLLVRCAGELPGVRWNESARRLATAFWPGPLTLALPAEEGAFPESVVGAGGTVAARVSPHPAARAILEAVRRPITSTSVNLAGEAPASDADAAAAVIASAGAVDRVMLLDGGSLPRSEPSTVVDCSREPPVIVRAGAVSPEALRRVIREIDDGR